MTKITGSCPVCGDQIKPAATQQQFNRNLGLHKYKRHNMRGASHSVQYKLRKKPQAQAMSQAAIPVSLPLCPCCGARFYAVKGDAS